MVAHGLGVVDAQIIGHVRTWLGVGLGVGLGVFRCNNDGAPCEGKGRTAPAVAQGAASGEYL